MNKYIIAPEGCNWTEQEAETPEAAYSLNCSWYKPGRRIAVIDAATGQACIFTRENGANGNFVTSVIRQIQEANK